MMINFLFGIKMYIFLWVIVLWKKKLEIDWEFDWLDKNGLWSWKFYKNLSIVNGCLNKLLLEVILRWYICDCRIRLLF